MLFENAIINHDKDPGMENHSSEFRRPKWLRQIAVIGQANNAPS